MFSIIFIFSAWGQKNYFLTFTNQNYQIIKKNVTHAFSDSLQAKKYLHSLQLSAISDGYLLASVDSMTYLPRELKVAFYVGPKFGKAALRLKEEDLLFFRRTMHINEKFFVGMPFTAKQISNTLRQMQNSLENNGFPFGKVFLD